MIELMVLMGVALVAGIAMEVSDDDDSFESQEIPDYDLPGSGQDSPTQNGSLLEGTQSADSLRGTTQDESIVGRGGNDAIRGQSGDDRLFGDDGFDTIDGGTGDDLVSGGSGNDLLTGGMGDDSVFGNDGNDGILEGRGADVINGNDGNDIIASSRFITDADGAIQVDTDFEADTVNGGDGDDVILFGRGDIVTGGDGDDDLIAGSWLEGREAATITDFEPDDDQLIYAYRPGTPAPILTMTTVPGEDGSSDALVFANGQAVLRIEGQGDSFDPSLDIRLVQDGSVPDQLLRS